MSGFSNPIIGGGGGLVYPSIHSPDYVPGTSGWSINKDGTAEFDDLILHGGIQLFYSGTAAANTLVASVSASGGTDSHGNVYLPGVVSYWEENPGIFFAAQMYQGQAQFYIASSEAGPWALVSSLQPYNASGNDAGVAINGGMRLGSVDSAFMNYIVPSGDTTGATDVLTINSYARFGYTVCLLPGQWYLNQGITLGTSGQVICGCGPATVINDVAAFTGTALFYPTAQNHLTIRDLAFNTTVASFIDFQNDNTNYLLLADIIGSAGTLAPDMITNFNLHRSTIERLTLTQNNPGASILTMGASGTGLSTTTFRDCKFIAACAAGGVGIPGNRTVPAINILVPGNKNLDVVRFIDCWCNNAMNGTNLDNAQYFMFFACTQGGANHDEDRLYFDNVSFNQVLGGAIKCQSIVGAVFDKVSVGNVFSVTTPSGTKATAASFLNIGTFAGGQHSQAISIRDYEREGTANLTSGSNPSDIQLSSDTVNVLVENPHVPDSGGNIQVDTGGCTDFDLVTANSNLVFVTLPGTGSVNSNGVLTLYQASGGVAYSVNGGNAQATTAAGFAQNLSGSKLSSISTASVTSTAQASLGFRSIPAGDVVAGGAHLIKASGSFTFGATPPSSATFGVYWGGLAGTQIATLTIPAADMPAGAITQAGWWVLAEVEWVSLTSCEVTLKVGWHSGSGVGASVEVFSVTTTTGLTTTAAQNLTLAFQWGSAPASTLLSTDVCRIGRIA